jgi:periplasmic copper chaperone A
MKRIILSICLLLLSPFVLAQPVEIGSITIESAWARPTVAKMANGATYLTLVNHGTQPDRLLSASTTVAAETQIHHTIMDNGIMRMRQLKDGVELPAGQSVKFAPGGLHIMLIGLKAPLKAGDHFVLGLQFAKAGKTDITVMVHEQDAGSGMNMPMH